MPVEPAEPLPDAGFDVVRRGYDPSQVHTHLRRIDAEISILAADRNAAVDQSAQLVRELEDARARAEKLRAQVRTLAAPPQSVQGMSERMRSMLRLAEDEVAEMLAQAETDAAKRRVDADEYAEQTIAAARAEADSFLAPAQMEAGELTAHIAAERSAIAAERTEMQERIAADRAAAEQETAAHRGAVEDELATLRAATQQRIGADRAAVDEELTARRAGVEEQLERANREAEDRRTRIWAESEARRTTVEQDFTIAMDQRRSEALRGLSTEQAAVRREVDGLRATSATQVRDELARARRQAEGIVADAQRRVVELTELRTRVAEQLGGVQGELGRLLGTLAPLPAERPAARTNGAADQDTVVTAPAFGNGTPPDWPASPTPAAATAPPSQPTPSQPTPSQPTPAQPTPARPTPARRDRPRPATQDGPGSAAAAPPRDDTRPEVPELRPAAGETPEPARTGATGTAYLEADTGLDDREPTADSGRRPDNGDSTGTPRRTTSRRQRRATVGRR